MSALLVPRDKGRGTPPQHKAAHCPPPFITVEAGGLICMAQVFPVPSFLSDNLKQYNVYVIAPKSLLVLHSFQIFLEFPDLESQDLCWPALLM